jgi:putative FmdB family regulatory protein
MPTYQYACTSCGEQLEVVQKFSDDPLTICPACSGALRKVFSPVGVVFKGSGFYKTDSRSKSSSGSSTAKDSSKDSSSTGSSSGSGSKSSSESSGSTTSSTGESKPATGGSSGDRVA